MMTMFKTLLGTTTLLTTLALTACGGASNDDANIQAATTDTQQNTALMRLAQLQQSVEYAEDLSAIMRLQKSYGYYLDKGLWTDLAEYFADNARANYPAGIYVGKESIRQHLYRNVGAVEVGEVGLGDDRLYNHMNIQPVVHLDDGGNTARGRWRAMAMFGRYGTPAGTWAEGIYNMRYVKEDGVWKIQDLDYHSGFGDSYATGWGTNPDAQPGSGARNLPHPADQQRSMPCDGFPQPCIAPFHYENLGTSDDSNVWHPSPVRPLPADTNVAAKAAELLQRAQILRDEQQIENLQRIYGYYIDRNMWTDVAALFSANGTVEYAQQGIYRGPERIHAYLSAMAPEGLRDGVLNDHVQLQTIVTVAPDGRLARARTREWNMTGEVNVGGQWSEGIFENSFIKEGGQWKFASLKYYPTFITDYDKGWTVDAQSAPGILEDLPPDAPPSEIYEIFPKAHVPPFHYMNPVTGRQSTYPQVGAPSASAIAATEFRPADHVPDPAANITATLKLAEQLMQQVKSHREIENLENAYGYYLDKNLWNDLADLFTSDGSMELAQRGVYKGRERVREFLFQVFGTEGPTQGRLGNHLHMQPVITLNNDGVTGHVRSRMMQQLSFNGRPSMGAAVYENLVAKEDGKWKFRSTHAYNTWTAGYADGWARVTSSRVPGQSESFPPDTPPSFQFSMFPTVYPFPFHYKQ